MLWLHYTGKGTGVCSISAQQAGRTAAAKVAATVLKNAGTPKDTLAGDWLSYGHTQGETRFSPLKQIDTTNVSRTRVTESSSPFSATPRPGPVS